MEIFATPHAVASRRVSPCALLAKRARQRARHGAQPGQRPQHACNGTAAPSVSVRYQRSTWGNLTHGRTGTPLLPPCRRCQRARGVLDQLGRRQRQQSVPFRPCALLAGRDFRQVPPENSPMDTARSALGSIKVPRAICASCSPIHRSANGRVGNVLERARCRARRIFIWQVLRTALSVRL